MKKLIAFTVAAVMVLSLIPVMTLSSFAAEITGDWTTLRRPADYLIDEEAGETYKPAPGYEYTDEGFTIVPADYTNQTVYFNIQTKDPKPIKEGFYVQFRVDDYCYTGPDDSADAWIGLSLWDSVNLQPGNTSYGAGWVCLIRGVGDGSATAQSHISTPSSEGVTGQFLGQGENEIKVPMENDCEIYTLEVKWEGSAYVIKINGVEVGGSRGDVTSLLEQQNANGDFYVGISFHSTYAGGTAACTILKQGTSAEDATTPVGTDSKDPEGNIVIFPDPIDPSTVPAGKPALLWDANRTSFRGEAYGAGASYTAQGDGSYHVRAVASLPSAMWHVKSSLSYRGEDFPVLAILTRDFWGTGGSLYYCGGSVLAAQDSASLAWNLYDEYNLEYQDSVNDNVYNLIIIDLTDLWEGRINAYQPHFSVGDYTDPEAGEFDICYMGAFRNVEEAHSYYNEYMAAKGLGDSSSDETTAVPETAPNDPETVPETIPVTMPVTLPADAEPTTDAPNAGGCASVVSFGAVAILSAAAACVAWKKKD